MVHANSGVGMEYVTMKRHVGHVQGIVGLVGRGVEMESVIMMKHVIHALETVDLVAVIMYVIRGGVNPVLHVLEIVEYVPQNAEMGCVMAMKHVDPVQLIVESVHLFVEMENVTVVNRVVAAHQIVGHAYHFRVIL